MRKIIDLLWLYKEIDRKNSSCVNLIILGNYAKNIKYYCIIIENINKIPLLTKGKYDELRPYR